MTNQEILDNAPEDANEIEHVGFAGVNYMFNPFKPNRSLADIKRIAELEQELKEYEMAYETIVQILNDCFPIVEKQDLELAKKLHLIIGFTAPSQLLEIRDLEQQKKGFRDAICWIDKNFIIDFDKISAMELLSLLTVYTQELGKQIKQLKGGE